MHFCFNFPRLSLSLYNLWNLNQNGKNFNTREVLKAHCFIIILVFAGGKAEKKYSEWRSIEKEMVNFKEMFYFLLFFVVFTLIFKNLR